MNVLTHTLPITLQQARKARRLSQLELSMRVSVSQRHISFVESGRAKPSRELLMSWLHELDAPLVVRNAAMLQASYAPEYSAAKLNDPVLARANDALIQLITSHSPLAFFSMFTTFGTPQDFMVASLRVEHMFAADAATRKLLDAQVPMKE